MHSILIAALLTVLQGSPAISKNAADLQELHRLEAVWNDAHVKGDADALDKLWANDLIVTVASMPVMNKADSLAMVRSGKMPFIKYETSDVRVTPLGTAALVTGRVQRVRSMGGKEVTDDWHFTKVYAMSQGRWQVIAWHASPGVQTLRP
ncbi:MAG: nuclear transport factor 2 family protein [Acidobacteriota bacterium]|nr:nuclear transport factor 2 family protein [Acidobacteriota bacterium]